MQTEHSTEILQLGVTHQHSMTNKVKILERLRLWSNFLTQNLGNKYLRNRESVKSDFQTKDSYETVIFRKSKSIKSDLQTNGSFDPVLFK